eukprot:TRINITY_DN8745_c0_g1_i2.p1 TRINITY_DN8745_c0_g1~~TRINITY_DN8745_c0_g1_i2.p1  ORF type:complete len:590 (+),score=91.33 TRINITY_DN8745_c0_g1_i2:50-1771(+)
MAHAFQFACIQPRSDFPQVVATSDDETPSPVDFEAFEHTKENIRPHRSGRDPAVLAAVASSSSGSAALRHVDPVGLAEVAQAELDDQRRQRQAEFEASIATATTAFSSASLAADSGRGSEAHAAACCSDLVAVWSEYAAWAAQWFPVSSREERSILEKATSALVAIPRCRGDLRYLEIWCRLAEHSRGAEKIFSFLFAQGIGVSHARLYEAWAALLERELRVSEAVETLDVGIARCAEPLERLRTFRDALTRRVHERILEDSSGLDEPMRFELNPITPAEAQCMSQPTERRYLQSAGLFTNAQPTFARNSKQSTDALAGEAVPPLHCLEDSSHGHKTSIFDAHVDWKLPTVAEPETCKENVQSASARFPHQVGGRRGQANVAGYGRCSGGPSRGPPALGALSVFVDSEFDVKAGSKQPQQSAIGSTSAAAAAPATPTKVVLSPQVRRSRRRPLVTDDSEFEGADLARSFSNLRLSECPRAKRTCHVATASIACPQAEASSVRQNADVLPDAANGLAQLLHASSSMDLVSSPPRTPPPRTAVTPLIRDGDYPRRGVGSPLRVLLFGSPDAASPR